MSRPKLLDQPVTEADIREYLATQDDLGLEMQCVRLCRDRRWDVQHGGMYTDSVTKKTRQFDIRAQKENNNRRIYLAVECKALTRSFPLVVSRLPRVKEETFHELLFSAEAEAGSTEAILGQTGYKVRSDWRESYYEKGSPVGKHTVQIGRSPQKEIITGDAESFEKWSQAIASAHDLIGDAASAHEGSHDGYMVSVILPVLLVPDATLWTADYTAKGTLVGAPALAESAEIYIAKDHSDGMVSYTISHLHVVTVGGFTALLESLADNGNGWNAWFPRGEIEKAVRKN